MLKEKDKRIVLLVIFGVALVSLITATIACFVDSITVFCDAGSLYNISAGTRDPSYYYLVAYILIVLGVLGVAYLCVKLFVRKSFIPALVMASIILLYVIVSCVALRSKAPTFTSYSSRWFYDQQYSFFQTTYVAVAVTLAITTAMTEVSHLLVLRMDRKQAKDEAQEVDA